MKKEFPLSIEEESAMQSLGGFDYVVETSGKILRQYGINRDLFSPEERRLVRLGRDFAEHQIGFCFDPNKSLHTNLRGLFEQAVDLGETSSGANYIDTLLQHLVGAKLDLVLGEGKIPHHGSSVADHSTARQSDFQLEAVAVHVTSHPSEALIRKCDENLRSGLNPLIITLGDGVEGAAFLLKNANLLDRVDVLDVGQFLTANVYERSLFKAAACKVTLSNLLNRYNEIVAECETDPALRIAIKADGK